MRADEARMRFYSGSTSELPAGSHQTVVVWHPRFNSLGLTCGDRLAASAVSANLAVWAGVP
jgi:hypothetical protein